MKQDKEFMIRSYGKSELAMRYFPDAASKNSALKRFRYWLSINKDLCHLLKSKGQRWTPRQVRKIVRVVGEPYGNEDDTEI